MPALIQVAILAILAAGAGYWIWRAAKRPAPLRAATWLWCGLAGFGLLFLLLQALAYVDLPLRRTAQWAFAFALAGVVLLGRDAWRARRAIFRRRRWEIGLVLGAGVGAGMLHAASLMAIGSDRFIGFGQVDHVNYVTSAQFLADEPYSTDLPHIGLRPWLWMPLRWKQARLTQSVVLGSVAVLARTDAQRAWGATAVFFTGLLGASLAGMWRVTGRRPWTAAALGFAGAAIPGVTYIYLIGFFSQLAVLFVFPALIATCWTGRLPRPVAAGLTACLLGYLAGTYPDFWLVAVPMVGGAMLLWPLGFWRRVTWAAATVLGSVVLTGIFASMILRPLFRQLDAKVNWTQLLSGFVPAGIGWRGWGWNFFTGSATWLAAAGMMVAAGMTIALVLEPRHRRWRWLATLAGPLALAGYFYLSPTPQVYPVYKLLATFAPIGFGLAAVGWDGVARRCGRFGGRVGIGFLLAGAVLSAGGALAGHLELVHLTNGANKDNLDRLWRARDRVEHRRADYLVENTNAITGAWLAYFARASNVYYDQPFLAEIRIPTEFAPFRKIPGGQRLEWLDLERFGPAPARESSPSLGLSGARSEFELEQRAVYVLGPEAEVTITRAAPAGSPPREFALEFVFTPLAGVGPCELELIDGRNVVAPVRVQAGARVTSIRLRVESGRNVYQMRVRPEADRDRPAVPGRDLGLLQLLSLERPEDAAY
ncbi:MAG TPA: hypothetical protein VL200_00770 [Lacunisphaera sp.]|jgi:hypothetical protein|nr:hypothetical protein [Lacunisphaera sp.]